MSRSAAVRADAAKIVADVATRGRSLDAALSFDNAATRQERGLLRALAYDSIRWYLRLDALLERLLARPGQKLDPDVRALAIVGLCQLLYTEIPAHAAVAETVEAARVLGHARAAGFINALLRRCQREHAQLTVQIDRDITVRTAHPRWLVNALAADWGEQSAAILAANNQRPPFWVRVNRRRISGPDYRNRLAASGIEVAQSMFGDEALLLADAMDVAELPGFADGEVSIQDAAAQLGARLVAPRAGERVLDACAAPGGKTGHLLELQAELAQLVAVDVSPERLTRIADNLRRLGLSATLVAGDAAAPADWWDGQPFQRILLDVPCSATGVIRRHPDIKLLRRPEDVAALANTQLQLLQALWALLAPGGRLVYASCSALQAETVAVVEAFRATGVQARDTTAAAFADIGAIEATAPARAGRRIAAGTAGMDGFYYACLEKTEGQ
ncbi:MAG TPA: 16S rRNA (cytosine(967)-C(5))-methyltransferase RsmB [Steroidobacteraceae bacterium]|nr:16S rRNA (cytosine(967)-C(5))-methyltransferase RsmB [Steroidobacteraceae bacterium]